MPLLEQQFLAHSTADVIEFPNKPILPRKVINWVKLGKRLTSKTTQAATNKIIIINVTKQNFRNNPQQPYPYYVFTQPLRNHPINQLLKGAPNRELKRYYI